MPEVQCIRYPIRTDRTEAFVEAIASLNARTNEIAEVFAEAGIVAESVFVERSDQGDSVLIYTSAEDLRAAHQVLANSPLPLVRDFDRLLAEAVEIGEAVSLDPVLHAS